MLHEMTRTTSAERAKLVRVESHDVALDLTRDDEHFGATPVIRFSGLRPGAAGHADLRADKVPRLLAPYAALFPTPRPRQNYSARSMSSWPIRHSSLPWPAS
jgi:hypothetical protein